MTSLYQRHVQLGMEKTSATMSLTAIAMRKLWIPLLIMLLGITEGEERTWNTEPAYETQGVNVTVIEGKTAILPCSVHDTPVQLENKKVKVVWTDQWSTILTFEEKTIIDEDRIHVDHTFAREWNLRIDRVKYGDQGIYTCQVNTEPMISYTVHLTVVVPPRLANDGTGGMIEVMEGSKAELVCNATGIPAPTITWFRKVPDVAERRERIGEAGQVLVIHNVTRYCGGTYECVAENGVPPSVRREIKVKVKFQPEITLPTKRISQVMGKDTILECMVSAHPQGQAMWKFQGKQITSNQKYSVNIYPQIGTDIITLSLQIHKLTPEDFGKYSCIASNSLGQTSKKMLLSEHIIRTKPTPTTATTTTTSSTSSPALVPPTQGKGRGPHADRRVHPDNELPAGGSQHKPRTEQSQPPQSLDSNSPWQPVSKPSSESEAKADRISTAPSGPESSALTTTVLLTIVLALLLC